MWAHQCILITKKRDILILGKDPTQGLDGSMLAAEGQYSVNYSRSNRNFSAL